MQGYKKPTRQTNETPAQENDEGAEQALMFAREMLSCATALDGSEHVAKIRLPHHRDAVATFIRELRRISSEAIATLAPAFEAPENG